MAMTIAASELPSPPFVAVEGVTNFRDIGGYPITGSDSKSVKRGFVYRSANPSGITDDGLKTLVSALGIRVIFDLRLQQEVTMCKIKKFPGVETIHIPVDSNSWAYPLPEELLSFQGLLEGNYRARWYAEIMFAGLFRRVFEHVRDKPDEPFLIHCFAGMDRTGVLVALMLRIAGVSEDVVVNEFELTNIYIAARFDGKYGLAQGKQMKVSVRWLDEVYGGIEGYFKDVLKFQDEDIRKIKKNLVVREKPTLNFSENGVCLMMEQSLSSKAWCTSKFNVTFLASVFVPLTIFFYFLFSLGLFRGEQESVP